MAIINCSVLCLWHVLSFPLGIVFPPLKLFPFHVINFGKMLEIVDTVACSWCWREWTKSFSQEAEAPQLPFCWSFYRTCKKTTCLHQQVNIPDHPILKFSLNGSRTTCSGKHWTVQYASHPGNRRSDKINLNSKIKNETQVMGLWNLISRKLFFFLVKFYLP